MNRIKMNSNYFISALLVLLLTSYCTGAISRKNLELTVYNQDFAFIREQRELELKAGINELSLTEIPALIEPTSVHFKSLTDPAGTFIIEQNFDYDLLNANKLMEKYIGKQIQLGIYRGMAVDAILLSTGQKQTLQQIRQGTIIQPTDSGGRILEIDGKIHINPPGTIILPPLSEGLTLKPTLNWLVSANKTGRHLTELSYLSYGINWTADYVFVIDETENYIDLTSWVTLDNRSGTYYENAKLKLMAGDINLVQPVQRDAKLAFAAVARAPAMEADTQFQAEEFFEYHLYTLQRPVTIKDDQIKQIEFIKAVGVPYEKFYVYDGLHARYRGWWRGNIRDNIDFGITSNNNVSVVLELVNSEKNKLGIPLPAGKIRLFQKDENGSKEFIGEDIIDHTPKNEKFRISTGNAFDIVGERIRTNYQVIVHNHVVEESFEIRVRNRKNEPVNVHVLERLYRSMEWEITVKSDDYIKKDAQSIEFLVEIPADSEKIINYTVRYNW